MLSDRCRIWLIVSIDATVTQTWTHFIFLSLHLSQACIEISDAVLNTVDSLVPGLFARSRRASCGRHRCRVPVPLPPSWTSSEEGHLLKGQGVWMREWPPLTGRWRATCWNAPREVPETKDSCSNKFVKTPEVAFSFASRQEQAEVWGKLWLEPPPSATIFLVNGVGGVFSSSRAFLQAEPQLSISHRTFLHFVTSAAMASLTVYVTLQ